jgi:hypothetical protein
MNDKERMEHYRRLSPAEKMAERVKAIDERILLDVQTLRINYLSNPAAFREWISIKATAYGLDWLKPLPLKKLAARILREILCTTVLGIPEELERENPGKFLEYWQGVCILHWLTFHNGVVD